MLMNYGLKIVQTLGNENFFRFVYLNVSFMFQSSALLKLIQFHRSIPFLKARRFAGDDTKALLSRLDTTQFCTTPRKSEVLPTRRKCVSIFVCLTRQEI